MGGSDQPYIYPPCAPLSERQLAFPNSDFNPKARTQAAYQALHEQNRPKPKQNGPLLRFDQPVTQGSSYMVVSGNNVNYTPVAYEAFQAKKEAKSESDRRLVNFNQHPDSWEAVRTQRTNYKPMPPSTRKKVVAIRWVQFALRLVTEIGALGILVCMICLTNMPRAVSWIMRIAPAWDVIVTLYAIYHLVRPATARTPASSASYHIFALANDIGLLPFYVYICLYSRINYYEDPGNKDRWHSMFSDPEVTSDLLFATFLGTIAVGGLHLLSAVLDLWLTILFKNIARLPPDVNPLEDNLTTRTPRRSKHKYKNSEATLTEPLSEKHPGFLSGSTLSVDQQSQLSGMNKDVDEADSRKIPFNHTRARQYVIPQIHTSDADEEDYDDFEEVKLYNSPETDRNSFKSPSQVFDKQLSNHASSPSPREVIPWPPQVTERSTVTMSKSPGNTRVSVTDFARDSAPALPNAAPTATVVKSQQKSSLLNDNWYVIDDAESDLGTPSRSRTPAALEDFNTKKNNTPERETLMPQPLKMNPPTPPPPTTTEYPDPANEEVKFSTVIQRKPLVSRPDNGNADFSRNPTAQSNYTAASSIYSDDDPPPPKVSFRPGTPKGKYYGDLAAATRGVLGAKSKAKATTEVSRIWSSETAKSGGTIGASNWDSTGMSALSGYGYGIFPSKGRVVSRTGVDIADATAGGDGALGMRARRDVSGKVAEEGRAGKGVWWSRK